MLHSITVVHLSCLGLYAAIGLKGMLLHRGKNVSIQLVRGGETVFRITHSDLVYWFAVLSYLTLDSTSLELIFKCRDMLKSGEAPLLTISVLTIYLTTLICALGYAFISTLTIVANFVGDKFKKHRT